MSLRLTDLVKRLLSRPVRTAKPLTARLGCETLEDRTVPTAVVTIAALGNVTEGGATAFRLTRTDTTGGLTVNLATADTADPIDGSGTATPGADYTLPTTATFTNGQATVDVAITTANDTTSEPMEAVTLAVTNGLGYTVGTPDAATLYILDNDTPQANPDGFPGDEDDTVTGNVLTNDTDPNGSTMTASLDTGPFFGTVDLNSDGSFEYTPAPDFFGTDVFVYEVSDGGTGTTTAVVTLTIAPVDDAPVIADQEFTIPENLPDDAIVGIVTATDPDAGQTLTYSITAGNSGGVFTIDPDTGVIQVADGSALNYEVTPAFALTVQVTDDGSPALSDTATIDIDLTNLAEDVQNETEEDRIQYLNGGYSYIQGRLDEPNPGSTSGHVGQALTTLNAMNGLIDAMDTAVALGDVTSFTQYVSQYNTALLTLNEQLNSVYADAAYATAAASWLVAYTEGDLFRLEGLASLMRIMGDDLDYLNWAVGVTQANANSYASVLPSTSTNLGLASYLLGWLADDGSQFAVGNDPTGAGVIADETVSTLNDLYATFQTAINSTAFGTASGLTSNLNQDGANMLDAIDVDNHSVDGSFGTDHAAYTGHLTSLIGNFTASTELPVGGVGSGYGAVGGVLQAADTILGSIWTDDPQHPGVMNVVTDFENLDGLRVQGLCEALVTLDDRLYALQVAVEGLQAQMDEIQSTLDEAGQPGSLANGEADGIIAQYDAVLAAIALRRNQIAFTLYLLGW